MKSQYIILRSSINVKKVLHHIQKFFRETKFQSNYICLSVILCSENGSIAIGEKTFLDLKNNSEIKSYRFTITQKFNKLAENNPDLKHVDRILFYYSETTKEEYNNSISTIIENKSPLH